MVHEETVDVMVTGGGAAGIAAAVGARRSGATVRLVEQYPYLGGAATNSSVLTFCGFFDQHREQVVAGVGEEVLERLQAREVYQEHSFTWTGNHIVLLDLETTKVVLDDLVTDADVDVRLHSTLVGAQRTPEGTVTSVDIASRGGVERVHATTFIDASGDGGLLAAAGAGVHVAPLAERQTSTLVMRLDGIALDADLSREGMRAAVAAYGRETGSPLARDQGITVRLPVSGQVMTLLVDEQTDVLDAAAFTRDEVSARRQAWRYLDAFRRHLDGWQHAFLVETGPQMGIRESRRLRGSTILTRDDVLGSRKRPTESIGRCGWPIEDHVAPGVTHYEPLTDRAWYDIPYGALCSADTDNVWAAGRLVSADDDAFASVRVMGAAFATGHAAGIAAAQYAQGIPHDLARIRTELDRQGALV